MILPLIFLITLMFFILIQWSLYNADQELLKEKLDFQLKTQSLALKTPVWYLDNETVQSLVSLILVDKDFIGVGLLDDRGNPIASGGVLKDLSGEEMELWIRENHREGSSFREFAMETLGSEKRVRSIQYYGDSLPLAIYENGSFLRIGTLYLVASDLAQMKLYRERFVLMLLIFLSILFTITLSITLTYRQIVGVPLGNLKTSIQDALKAQGQSDPAVEPPSGNELDFLNTSFDQLWKHQKALEKELITRQQEFETYIDKAPIPMIIMSADQRILHLNENFIKSFGYTKEDVKTEEDLWNLLYPVHLYRENIKSLWSGLASEIGLENTGINAFEAKIQTKNGLYCFVEYRITMVGDIFIISVMDMTERKRAEEEKVYLLNQLSHKGKMDALGQLAGGIAHDFNNLLTGIIGASQMLLHAQRQIDEKSRKYIEMILQSSNRATELIRKLLFFSRKDNPVHQVVDFHMILDETVEILRNTVDKKINIQLRKKAENHFTVGDHSNLENALLNLGINACHAMENGGDLIYETSDITLDGGYCRKSKFDLVPGHYCRIIVSDTGNGIAPEYLEKIFEPFFTTKSQGKGTGLGLAIVYGTVKNHGGEILVKSVPGRGSSFELLLPADNHPVHSDEIPAEEMRGEGTILLVDDEEVNRILGQDVLERLGYRVVLAENGEEALQCVRSQPDKIDLVLLDVVMPRLGGVEAFESIHREFPDIPVLLSSGYTGNLDLQDLTGKGLRGFIPKPYDITEMSRLIFRALKEA